MQKFSLKIECIILLVKICLVLLILILAYTQTDKRKTETKVQFFMKQMAKYKKIKTHIST